MRPNVNNKRFFSIAYLVFSFLKLAISGASFLVVFDHFRIFKICCTFTVIVTYIKENLITKLQRLYSTSTKLRAGNKSPTLFLKKMFAWAIYCLRAQYSLKRSVCGWLVN